MDNNSNQKKKKKCSTSQIETSTPKSKFEDSPVFNFINNLSPIESIRSLSTAHTFNSLSFTSPPVFTSPHPTLHRDSRFFRCHNSVDRSKALESLDVSVSKEVVVADVDLNKDATLEEEEEEETSSELPQILKSHSQTPEHGEGDNDTSSEDVRVRLLKIFDAPEENDTSGRRRLTSDSAELLVFRSPNDSEAFQCLVDTISSSERRFCAGVKPTKQHDVTKDVPAIGFSNDNVMPLAIVPNQPVPSLHRGTMRRRCLDFEVPGKRKKDIADDHQTVCDNKAESSSKYVALGIGLHLNVIALASKDSKISAIHEYSTSGEIQKSFSGSNTPVHSQDTVRETLDQGENEAGEGSAVEEAPKELLFEGLGLNKPERVIHVRDATAKSPSV